MKNILITFREDIIREYSEIRFAIDKNMVEYLHAANINPIPFLYSSLFNENFIKDIIRKNQIRGLILSGGTTPSLENPSKRDIFEKLLISVFIREQLPILGICRGMQFINLFFGGKLIQCKGHVKRYHKLEVLNSNKKLPLTVNSFHNFMIDYDCLPKNLKCVALSGKSIEAFEDQSKKIFGIMWHPERDKTFDPKNLLFFKSFFS